jgi:hypothetical protein
MVVPTVVVPTMVSTHTQIGVMMVAVVVTGVA